MILNLKDYHDNKDHEDGFVRLICNQCKDTFHGWKFKTVCRVCAVPKFPVGVRHITHVAVIYKEKTYFLPAPDRHHHVLRLIYAEHETSFPSEEGFLDNEGKFLNRKEALAVALEAKQVLDIDSVRAQQLFSEDLW